MVNDVPPVSHVPVHVIVTRTPKPGKQAELIEWANGITQAATEFPGHLGAVIYPPAPPDQVDVVMAFSFATAGDLTRWENSATRAEWLAKCEPLSERTQYGASPSGFESLFGNRPGVPVTPPPRWKTGVVIFLALFPFSLLLNAVLGPLIGGWNLFPRVLLTTLLVVPYMTWLGVPYISRWLKPWLSKRG